MGSGIRSCRGSVSRVRRRCVRVSSRIRTFFISRRMTDRDGMVCRAGDMSFLWYFEMVQEFAGLLNARAGICLTAKILCIY